MLVHKLYCWCPAFRKDSTSTFWTVTHLRTTTVNNKEAGSKQYRLSETAISAVCFPWNQHYEINRVTKSRWYSPRTAITGTTIFANHTLPFNVLIARRLAAGQVGEWGPCCCLEDHNDVITTHQPNPISRQRHRQRPHPEVLTSS